MRAIVFDVPASTGGALTILREFYTQSLSRNDIQWTYVLSDEYVQKKTNIKVYAYKWAKKSWIHRIVFDILIAPSIVKNVDPDIVISFQNIKIRVRNKKQILYVHQPIPFSEVKFSVLKNPVEWVYQHVIGRIICRSIKETDRCIVQTNWMKQAIIRETDINPNRIAVIQPECNFSIDAFYEDNSRARRTFFYPASMNSYKNQRVIIKAVQILLQRGIADFEVNLTIEKTDIVDGVDVRGIDQVHCLGRMDYSDVMKTYAKSTLLFPSRMETYGLPLLEASMVNSRIIAIDKPFSHEILNNYGNVVYFDGQNPEMLAGLMEATMKNEIEYKVLDRKFSDEKSISIIGLIEELLYDKEING